MKTTMRFLSLASLALALAFTFSCSSDDDSSPSFACEIIYDDGERFCWEAYGGDKESHAERCEESDGSSPVNKCPGGSAKDCLWKHSGELDIKEFYYAERFRNMTCEEIDDL